eukprot:7926921-Karenia_brevis.AAC.1
MPGEPSQSYGPMGGSSRSTLRRQPTLTTDPNVTYDFHGNLTVPPVAEESAASEAGVAAEIAADLDRPNILPQR